MFTTLLLLFVPTVLLRLLGVVGVPRFATWRVCAAHGLAFMLVATGTAHFVPDSVTVMPSHDDLVAMVPSAVPFPHAMVYLTGVLELLGALGLIIASTRAVTGIAVAVLFVLLLPANVYAALEDIPLNGEPPTPLWFRIPEQLVFLTVALWATGAAQLSARLTKLGRMSRSGSS
ncbi:hypothetical protein [Nocardia sp. NPDC051833]|uniref:DoxX family protein n=1 Tax=Nocardia sp. NPDC051833 TaxID=3155674 RepID=UPI00341C07F7